MHRRGTALANGSGGRSGFALGQVESALSTKSVSELLQMFEASGDQAPFEEIVRRYAGMVYNVCYQISRDSHEAEDATQAVFLTLAVRSKTAQQIQYLGPWLQRVAQRLSLDMKRSKKRRAAREVKHHDLNVSRWEENNQPHDLGMDELRGILRDEIDRLPTKYRMPLILHYFGGLKPDEMSKELGIKANTLGVRLHRARKMLGDNLQKKGIVVGGTMLTAALGMLVPMYIQHTIASKATAAAAAYSLGHTLVAADVTAQVLGAMQVANRAAILAKIKAVTAAIAIGAAAVAGAGQLVRSISNSGFELRQLFDLGRWLSPVIDRLRSPIRLGDASGENLDRILAAKPSADSSLANAAPLWMGSWDVGHPASAAIEGQILASAGDLGGRSTIELQRVVVARAPDSALYNAHLPASRMQPQLNAAAFERNVANSAAMVAHSHNGAIPPSATAVVLPSVNSRFLSARDTFTLQGERLGRDVIRLDSQSDSLRSFRIQSGELRTRHLAVGLNGDAEVIQEGGHVFAGRLTIAAEETSHGRYELAGGELNAPIQELGVRGNSSFAQTGGVNTADTISLALDSSSVSTYSLNSGRIATRELNVGVRGYGEYNQAGGFASIIGSGDTGGVRVATDTGSKGRINVTAGTLEADKVFVGIGGDGQYTLSGGQTITNKIVIGTSDDSNSRLIAVNGTLVLDYVGSAGRPTAAGKPGKLQYTTSTAGAFTVAASDLLESAIVVGLNGDGVFQLGNARDSANLTEGTDRSQTPLVIRAVPSAKGEVVGWGDVDVRGPLINNGKLIADGFGRSRVLDLSSVASVANTIDNDLDGAYGLYARRNGQLRLPAIHVPSDGDFNWGESVGDKVPDLVNSVRIGFSGVRSPGDAKLTLLSPDDASTTTGLGAPQSELFVGLWKFDRVGLDVDSTRLLVRYDEQMVEHLGLPEAALSLWAYDGAWQQVGAADTILNTSLNLIGGELSSRFQYFGVSVSALGSSGMEGADNPFYIPGLVDFGESARAAAFIENVHFLTTPAPAFGSGPGTVPEPAAGAVLAIGASLLSRRRRR